MKHLLTLPLTALCLLSCSSSDHGNDPVPNPDDTRLSISFGGNSGTWEDAPTTRAAAENGLQSLYTSFRTWGYKTTDADFATSQLVMDGYHMQYIGASSGSTTSNTAGWEYVGIANTHLQATQSIKYWDLSASSYRFMAYSPFDANVTPITDVAGETSFSFPFEYSDEATVASFPYISKLWLSTDNTSGQLYGQPVKLSFAPALAKVRFKFSYPEGTESIEIRDIMFCDARFKDDLPSADTPLRGTIKATYPLTGKQTDTSPRLSWTPAANNATGPLTLTTPYEEEGDAIHILTDETQYGKWYYMPPLSIVPYQQGAYSMTARIDGNKASAIVPAEFMQWKPGFQYTYIFKITEAGTLITFVDLEVEEWLPGNDIENKGTGTEGW